MVLLIIVGALLLSSALAKAVQDSIAHHNSLAQLMPADGHSQFWHLWWNHKESWRNKYKKLPDVIPGVFNTSAEPRFFGSTTFLVFVTDAWHFFGMLNMSAWQAAICLLLPFAWYYQLLAFVLIKIGYGGGFELLYRWLNKQK